MVITSRQAGSPADCPGATDVVDVVGAVFRKFGLDTRVEMEASGSEHTKSPIDVAATACQPASTASLARGDGAQACLEGVQAGPGDESTDTSTHTPLALAPEYIDVVGAAFRKFGIDTGGKRKTFEEDMDDLQRQLTEKNAELMKKRGGRDVPGGFQLTERASKKLESEITLLEFEIESLTDMKDALLKDGAAREAEKPLRDASDWWSAQNLQAGKAKSHKGPQNVLPGGSVDDAGLSSDRPRLPGAQGGSRVSPIHYPGYSGAEPGPSGDQGGTSVGNAGLSSEQPRPPGAQGGSPGGGAGPPGVQPRPPFGQGGSPPSPIPLGDLGAAGPSESEPRTVVFNLVHTEKPHLFDEEFNVEALGVTKHVVRVTDTFINDRIAERFKRAALGSSEYADFTEVRKQRASAMFNLIVATACGPLAKRFFEGGGDIQRRPVELSAFWGSVTTDTINVGDFINSLFGDNADELKALSEYNNPRVALEKAHMYSSGCYLRLSHEKCVLLRDAAAGFFDPNKSPYQKALQSLVETHGCKVRHHLIDIDAASMDTDPAYTEWLELRLQNVFSMIHQRNMAKCKDVTELEAFETTKQLTIYMGAEVDELLALMTYAMRMYEGGTIHVRLPNIQFYQDWNISRCLRGVFSAIGNTHRVTIQCRFYQYGYGDEPIARTISTQLEYLLNGNSFDNNTALKPALVALEEAARFYKYTTFERDNSVAETLPGTPGTPGTPGSPDILSGDGGGGGDNDSNSQSSTPDPPDPPGPPVPLSGGGGGGGDNNSSSNVSQGDVGLLDAYRGLSRGLQSGSRPSSPREDETQYWGGEGQPQNDPTPYSPGDSQVDGDATLRPP